MVIKHEVSLKNSLVGGNTAGWREKCIKMPGGAFSAQKIIKRGKKWPCAFVYKLHLSTLVFISNCICGYFIGSPTNYLVWRPTVVI